MLAAWPKGLAPCVAPPKMLEEEPAPKGEGEDVPKGLAAGGLPKGAAWGWPKRPPAAPAGGGPPGAKR